MFDESDPFAPIPDSNKPNNGNDEISLDQPLDEQTENQNLSTQHQSLISDTNFSQRQQLDDDDPFGAIDDPSPLPADPGFEFAPVSPTQQQPKPAQQETAFTVWERERAQVLQKRAQKVASDKMEAQAQAKRDIEQFYKEQQAKLQQRMKINRADEKSNAQEMHQLFESGSQWEKVAKLCNLNARATEKGAAQRTERFRKLLISLKQKSAKK